MTYLNVEKLFGQNRWAFVDRLSRTIEGSSKHFDTDWHSQHVSSELASSVLVVDVSSTFENLEPVSQQMSTYLHDGLLTFDLEHLAFALSPVAQSDIHDLSILREFDVIQHDERALDVEDGAVVNSRGDFIVGLKMIFHGFF